MRKILAVAAAFFARYVLRHLRRNRKTGLRRFFGR
jgi:hypothetical protein